MSSAYLPGRRIPHASRLAEPIYLPPEAACPDSDDGRPLGRLLVEARERRGLTREQAAHESNILASYLEMMETGNYSAIPDLLYLLPFFRRYAEFLGLDPGDVTTSFMRDFEAEENAAVQIPKPPRTRTVTSLPWRRIAQAGVLVAAAVSLAAVAAALVRHSGVTKAPSHPTAMASPAALTQPSRAASPVSANPPAHSASQASTTPNTAPMTSRSYHGGHSSSARHRRASHWHHRTH